MKRKELILYGENWDRIVIIQFHYVYLGQHVTLVFTQYFRIDGWPIDLTCHLISNSYSSPLSLLFMLIFNLLHIRVYACFIYLTPPFSPFTRGKQISSNWDVKLKKCVSHFLSNKSHPFSSLFVPSSLSAVSLLRRRRLKVRYSIFIYLLQFGLIMRYLILTMRYSIEKFSRCNENWLRWNRTQDKLRFGSENFKTTRQW